ncbi:protein phosphatase 1 regulatory subunit sds22 [Gregarina niphandrodes]|uniref:Protein phosphatase 1 regulatory subunit sds22 n=1 Tax=Gregarina niphandrodes TaxID=110365 RepID=A0A023B536_GRENI|nr:protein phosphatase 1 regulatory subunit sds22 [Gregarina niphandrodes]EZG57883.1 protein phosphatase 1 regulatory subunit sds22 [Gregarina niphandrodes]|eukprot:XP_011131004.1 protein phosphatase 1 regulatory subunit sds22 [Gregarina niphandrodes]
MEGFDGLAKLEELECGSNRIRNVSGITNEMGKSLKQLWLGRNKIASMLLPYMPALEILSFQCNRLENWDDDLSIKCPNLKELYVSENHLPNPPCSIIGLKQLHTLDLGNNKIQKLDFIGQMIWLKELWLNGNDIQELEEVRKLSTLVNLDTIYLEHNPIKDQLGPGYRQAVLDILPNLKQIDAIYLGQIVVT